MEKVKHPWITNGKGQIFNQPFFDKINLRDWHEELPKLYKRINSAKDERSYVILLSIVLEYHLDKLLRIVIPGYNKLCERAEFTFSLKLCLLESLRIVPPQIFMFTDCIRKIRNEFAHNLQIDSLLELSKLDGTKSKLIKNLVQLTSEYQDYLVYSKYHPDKLKFHFKDIANFVIHAFREYEPNFVALRNEIDTPDFAENLSTKNKNKLLRLEYIE
jgi:hypothetical protein